MKKILIATTALIAATAASGAQASEKIKLELGGYSKWWVVGAWNKDSYINATGQNPVAVDVKGDNEVFFSGSTKLDNGLTVGINVELEAGGNVETRNTGSTDVIDKSAVFIQGGFGKIIAGTEANGAVLLHVMAPDAAGNWASDGIATGQFALSAPAAFAAGTGATGLLGIRTTTEIDTDDNAEKITYVSPSFYGLTVGASYIPSVLSEDNRGYEAQTSPGYGVGALYAREFSGVGVKVSGGYVWYDLSNGNSFNNSIDEHKSNNREWSAGTQLSYNGFTVGGSFRGIRDEVGGLATVSSQGFAWDAGVQYETGPYAVSFAYFHSEAEGTINNPRNLKEQVYQVSGKYALGAGVDAVASGGYVKYDGENRNVAAENNKGVVVMTGLSLTF